MKAYQLGYREGYQAGYAAGKLLGGGTDGTAQPAERECLGCGRLFKLTGRSDQVYCDIACRSRANSWRSNQRKRAETARVKEERPKQRKKISQAALQRRTLTRIEGILLGIFPDGSPALEAEEKEKWVILHQVLGNLLPRERAVLVLRFGLEDGRSRTLEEVSREGGFGVTKERIRQIQLRALRKLRHPSRSRLLRPYLESPSQ